MKNYSCKNKILKISLSTFGAGVLITAPIILIESFSVNQITQTPDNNTSALDTISSSDSNQSTNAALDTFKIPYPSGDGYIKYQVLSEDLETNTGKVAITGYTGAKPHGDFLLPTKVIYNQITYTMISINPNAFANCDQITSLIIGSDNVTDQKVPDPLLIGEGAFNRCSSLTTVRMREGTNFIRRFAFKDCTSLIDIVFPTTLIDIGDEAFSGCKKLKVVSLPIGVQSIGAKTFNGCTSLATLIIPDSVTLIGTEAFNKCDGLKNVYMPKLPPGRIGFSIFGSLTFGSREDDPKIFLPLQESIPLYENLDIGIWPLEYRNYTVGIAPDPTYFKISGENFIELQYGSGISKIYSVTPIPINAQCNDIIWSMYGPPTPASNKIKIDRNTGELVISNNLEIGTHKITIRVAKNAHLEAVTAYMDIIIKVNGVLVTEININGPKTITADFGSEKSATYTAQVLPTNATNKNLVWSLNGDLANDKISINSTSGMLHVSNDIPLGTYGLKVQAVATDGSAKIGTFDITISVIRPAATGIIIGGSDVISTTSGIAVSQAYTAIVNPVNASQTVSWSLKDNSENEKIIVDKNTGVLSTANDLPMGDYNCTLVATAVDGSLISATKSITIKVGKPLTTKVIIDGANTIISTYGRLTTSTYTAKTTPSESIQSVSWSLTSPNNKITIKNGIVTVAANTPIGTYPCIIKATATDESDISETKPIYVKVTDPLATNIEIDGENIISTPAGTSISSAYKANVTPIQASQTVNWKFKDVFSTDDISINKSSGEIYVSANTPIGQYDCTVIATTTDGSGKFAEKNITINITTPIAQGVEIQGKDKIVSPFGSDISENYTASVKPTPASQSVVWSLKNVSSGNRVMIDPTSGKLSVPSDQAIGNYTCTVVCTTQDGSELSAEKDVEIDITTPLAASVTITGSSYITTEFGSAVSASYTAEITPIQALQEITWSLTGDDANGKISIDSDGNLLVPNDISIKEYHVNIIATTNDVPWKKAAYEVTIKVTTPSSAYVAITGKETINTPYGTPADTTYTAKVDPIGTSQEVTWSLEGDTSDGKILVNQRTGVLSVPVDTSIGEHHCTLVATTTDGSEKIGIKNIIIRVSAPLTEKLTIAGKNEVVSTFGVQAQENYTTTITPTGASSTISWSLKQPVADNKILVDSTGSLTISSDTPIGLYTCVLVATATDGSHISAEKTVTVNVIAPSPTKIIINGDINIMKPYGTSVDKPYTAVVGPAGASQIVNWSLEGNTDGGKIMIEPTTGILTVSEDTTMGAYECQVVATAADVNVVERKTINITVTKPVAAEVEIVGAGVIDATRGIATTESYQAVINPTQASQSVAWSLLGDTADSLIALDATGKLKVKNSIEDGSYNCQIKATAMGLSAVETVKNVTVVVSTPKTQIISILGRNEITAVYGKETISEYLAFAAPFGADQSVNWTLKGETSTGKIKINPANGLLSIANDTPVGIYRCEVIATAKDDLSIYENQEITINVVDSTIPDVSTNNDNTTAIIVGSTIGGLTLLGVITTAIVVSVKNNKTTKK